MKKSFVVSFEQVIPLNGIFNNAPPCHFLGKRSKSMCIAIALEKPTIKYLKRTFMKHTWIKIPHSI